MAIDIRDNLTEGTSGRIDNQGWLELREARIVTVDDGTGLTRLMAAVAGGPQVGSYHPVIPGLILNDVAPEVTGPGKFRIVYTYGRAAAVDVGDTEQPLPEGTDIEVGVENEQRDATKDIYGNNMMVAYYPFDRKTNTYVTDAFEGQYQQVKAPITIPHSTLTITRTEASSPGAKSRRFTGKLNSVVWNLSRTDAPLSWKCVGILGTSRNGGQTYRVTYRFIHSSSGWRHHAHAKDVNTGELVDLGNLPGYTVDKLEGVTVIATPPVKDFDVLPVDDFNALNLP